MLKTFCAYGRQAFRIVWSSARTGPAPGLLPIS
jgi:hypothetical protein